MNSQPQSVRRSRLGGWIAFLLCMLLLSFGATPYHKAADTALIAVRLSILLVVSLLMIRERWNHRHDLPGGRSGARDKGETALQRLRAWYYDSHGKN